MAKTDSPFVMKDRPIIPRHSTLTARVSGVSGSILADLNARSYKPAQISRAAVAAACASPVALARSADTYASVNVRSSVLGFPLPLRLLIMTPRFQIACSATVSDQRGAA